MGKVNREMMLMDIKLTLGRFQYGGETHFTASNVRIMELEGLPRTDLDTSTPFLAVEIVSSEPAETDKAHNVWDDRIALYYIVKHSQGGDDPDRYKRDVIAELAHYVETDLSENIQALHDQVKVLGVQWAGGDVVFGTKAETLGLTFGASVITVGVFGLVETH
jgi:hypothetical protein